MYGGGYGQNQGGYGYQGSYNQGSNPNYGTYGNQNQGYAYSQPTKKSDGCLDDCCAVCAALMCCCCICDMLTWEQNLMICLPLF